MKAIIKATGKLIIVTDIWGDRVLCQDPDSGIETTFDPEEITLGSAMIDTVEKRFKEQGGTGFLGALFTHDCACAVGALYLADGWDATRTYENITKYPGAGRDALERKLSAAHDNALCDVSSGTVELEGYKEGRCLIGTPAYDYVMDALRNAVS